MHRPKLKPCPFCGADNRGHENIVELYDDEHYKFTKCQKCGAIVYSDWNSPPIEDKLRSENVALVVGIKRLDRMSVDDFALWQHIYNKVDNE